MHVFSTPLPGAPLDLVVDPAGREYVLLHSDNRDMLHALELSGATRWCHSLPPSNRWRASMLRTDGAGTLVLLDPTGLTRLSLDGAVLDRCPLPAHTADARAIAYHCFALLPDGLLLSGTLARAPAAGIVTRLDAAGHVAWSTTLQPDTIAHPGVVTMSRDEGSHPHPWRPETWVPEGAPRSTGDVVFAHFHEMPRSGIGVTYGLDLATGRVRFSASPQPFGERAVYAPGRMLVGAQGYDVFETHLLDADGRVVCEWPSHGRYLVLPNGDVLVVEMENVLPSRSSVALLSLDGTVRRGTHLEDYYTSPLARTGVASAAYWRSGALFEVDPSLTPRRLLDGVATPDAWPTALELDAHGTLHLMLSLRRDGAQLGELWRIATAPGD